MAVFDTFYDGVKILCRKAGEEDLNYLHTDRSENKSERKNTIRDQNRPNRAEPFEKSYVNISKQILDNASKKQLHRWNIQLHL